MDTERNETLVQLITRAQDAIEIAHQQKLDHQLFYAYAYALWSCLKGFLQEDRIHAGPLTKLDRLVWSPTKAEFIEGLKVWYDVPDLRSWDSVAPSCQRLVQDLEELAGVFK